MKVEAAEEWPGRQQKENTAGREVTMLSREGVTNAKEVGVQMAQGGGVPAPHSLTSIQSSLAKGQSVLFPSLAWPGLATRTEPLPACVHPVPGA